MVRVAPVHLSASVVDHGLHFCHPVGFFLFLLVLPDGTIGFLFEKQEEDMWIYGSRGWMMAVSWSFSRRKPS